MNAKERPILFSTEMVRAILDGRKTMTRRVVKNILILTKRENGQIEYIRKNETFTNHPKDICPYGQIGDVLWVRETWSPLVIGVGKNFDSIVYKADGSEPSSVGWEPSIFMPRSASRISLRITNIRVERLNDITEEDAKREGVEPIKAENIQGYKDYLKRLNGLAYCGDALASFRSLWRSINGKGSWEQNPWVWVIEFEVIK